MHAAIDSELHYCCIFYTYKFEVLSAHSDEIVCGHLIKICTKNLKCTCIVNIAYWVNVIYLLNVYVFFVSLLLHCSDGSAHLCIQFILYGSAYKVLCFFLHCKNLLQNINEFMCHIQIEITSHSMLSSFHFEQLNKMQWKQKCRWNPFNIVACVVGQDYIFFMLFSLILYILRCYCFSSCCWLLKGLLF